MPNTVSSIEFQLQTHRNSILGILSALVILTLWVGSLVWLLPADLSGIPIWGIAAIFLVRMFLHTGLFITAHDAMHGTICPTLPQLNRPIGSLAIGAYALLPYQVLLEKHRMHHYHPATERDPDFCRKYQHNAVLWFVAFMVSNMKYKGSWLQLLAMTVLFHSLWAIFHVPIANVLFVWSLPMLASTVQMFYFGVFLPHREPKGGHTNRHRSQSSQYPIFWSFLTCYHFGYHWEHHEYPHLPWYKLPSAVKS